MKLDTRCHVFCRDCGAIIGIRFFKCEFNDFSDHDYKDVQCTRCFVKDDIEARKK